MLATRSGHFQLNAMRMRRRVVMLRVVNQPVLITQVRLNLEQIADDFSFGICAGKGTASGLRSKIRQDLWAARPQAGFGSARNV